MSRVINVVLLITDAGAGHRSAAQAIEAALLQTHGDSVHVSIVNPLLHLRAPSMLRFGEQFYLELVKYAPQYYDWLHLVTDNAPTVSLISETVSLTLRNVFREVLAQLVPDVIVSVYPQFSAFAASLYAGQRTRPGLVSVVTDLGPVHRFWFEHTDDYCIVPSTAARTKALSCGMDPQRVLTSGIPVHPRFARPRAEVAELRRSLGWRADLPAMLLLGGGAGVGDLVELARAVDAAGLPLQMAIVAGRNAELAAELRAQHWANPTAIYDFVPLADMMHAADIVATKGGGLTVSEALAAGRPLLLHGAAPGQELGNVQHVVNHGAGLYGATPGEFVANLRRWIVQPAAREAAAAAARSIGQPHAAHEVAQVVWELGMARPQPEPLTLRRNASRRASWLN